CTPVVALRDTLSVTITCGGTLLPPPISNAAASDTPSTVLFATVRYENAVVAGPIVTALTAGAALANPTWLPLTTTLFAGASWTADSTESGDGQPFCPAIAPCTSALSAIVIARKLSPGVPSCTTCPAVQLALRSALVVTLTELAPLPIESSGSSVACIPPMIVLPAIATCAKPR